MKMKIGKRIIGDNEPCFIIAEIGSNHNRDFNKAIEMIDLAKDAGCDAVKFQSYKAETLYSKNTPRLKEMDGKSKKEETPYELIKRIETPYDWHKPLKEYCDKKEIIFLSSPFDFEAVDDLDKVGVDAFKVASSELTDMVLMKYIAKKNKPMIISTGKSTLCDIDKAVQWIKEEGNNNIVILHCVANYPPKYEDVNLNAIKTISNSFGLITGFSDHSMDNITATGAVALGAKVIEKHITLSRKTPGPDHPFALEKDGLFELVDNIRKIEKSLGNGIKKINDNEKESRLLANRSLHTTREMRKGEIVTRNDLITKRPALGIKPEDINLVIGRELKKDIKDDMWIKWDDI